MGELITTNGDGGTYSRDSTVSGFVGAISISHFYVYQKEKDGNMPTSGPMPPAGLYSWDIRHGIGGSDNAYVILRRDYMYKLPKLKPWIDPMLVDVKPKKYKPTVAVMGAFVRLAMRADSDPARVSKIMNRVATGLPAVMSNKYIEKITVSRGMPCIYTRPAHVKNDADVMKCGTVKGYRVIIRNVATFSVYSRDKIRPYHIHPNVNSVHNLCYGDYGQALHKSFEDGNIIFYISVLMSIIYGNGEHGYSSWPEYFRRYREIEERETNIVRIATEAIGTNLL